MNLVPRDAESPTGGEGRAEEPDDEFTQLVAAAQSGCQEAIGKLMEDCRDYLMLVANQDLDQALRGKIGASDVVQDALLSAQRAIVGFRGQSREEFLAWLRGIVLNDILETRRRYRGTAKRRVDREISLVTRGEGTALPIVEGQLTPASHAIVQEEAAMLKDAMAGLSEDHRQVLELRNWQQLSFSDIGARTGRSADAARKLWTRAVMALQQELNRDAGSSAEKN